MSEWVTCFVLSDVYVSFQCTLRQYSDTRWSVQLIKLRETYQEAKHGCSHVPLFFRMTEKGKDVPWFTLGFQSPFSWMRLKGHAVWSFGQLHYVHPWVVLVWELFKTAQLIPCDCLRSTRNVSYPGLCETVCYKLSELWFFRPPSDGS
jgi:hypothetical protein